MSTGLAEHGFTYVNIDDCWEAGRDAQGMIQANQKFPDMKALGEYIHAKGLKFGIYSSPGPKTCAGIEASYQHETQDAQQWANWGVDYIKYDLCSYTRMMKNVNDPVELQGIYGLLRNALDKAPRDIVYSLCEYGDGKVWEWGANPPVQGNLWRTTGDITDVWGSMAGIGFRQTGHEQFAGPGHWNDPDMLVVGRVGWGKTHPSRLTQNEQITHISLWSILAAPMLIGCDLTQIDDFTKGVLMNDEVLAVNQDPLGKQGYRVDKGEAAAQVQVYKRELWGWDGGGRVVQPGAHADEGDRGVERSRHERGAAGARSVAVEGHGECRRALHGGGAAARLRAHQSRQAGERRRCREAGRGDVSEVSGVRAGW